MSFLNGIFLLALPLTAAPVALHLLRRRQRQVVLWGAMQFLTDAVDKGRRFDRLEEWLLLALRAAALLALVLALARPLVRGLTPHGTATCEVVMVIDDSLSTGQLVDGKPVFDAIRAKASEFVESRAVDEGVRIVLAADGPRWLVDEPIAATTAGKRQLVAALDAAQPTAGAANFLGCLRSIASSDSAEESVDRRVVVFTDGQAKGWQVEARGVWDRLRAAIKQAPRVTSVQVVKVEPAASLRPNLSLDAVTASRPIAAEKDPLLFTAKITNTGKTDSAPAALTWSIDGQRRGESPIPVVGAGQTTSVQWRSSFDERGPHDVAAAITTPDQLSLDNDGGVVVEIVEAIPILVLAKSADLGDVENTFFATALGYDEVKQPTMVEAWHSLYRPTLSSFADLENESLRKYHAVVLNGLSELSPAAVEKLQAYVRDGGGLWLMLGPRIDRDDFNRRWYADGAGLIPLPLSSLLRPAERDSAEAAIHPPTGEHPATAMLADTDRLDIDRVRLRQYYTFRRLPGQEFTPLLESGRGEPLALLHHMGKGRVILQAYPLRTDWSDLPISKSFVVLVQDWLSYLTQPAATRFNLASREPLSYQLATTAQQRPASVKLPDGSTSELKPADRAGVATYRFGQTNLPGRYELQLPAPSDDRMLPFRVARDAAESDLTALTASDVAMLEETAGIHFRSSFDPSTASTQVEHARLEPAWWPLLIGMVCLMAAESLLATRVSRERFGTIAAEA